MARTCQVAESASSAAMDQCAVERYVESSRGSFSTGSADRPGTLVMSSYTQRAKCPLHFYSCLMRMRINDMTLLASL